MTQTAFDIWTKRAVFVLIALIILFFHLLPLDPAPSRFAGPDVMVAVVFAWAVRRPEYVPILLVAFVMLVTDFMLQRPPGLWSVLVVCAAEWLKSRDNRKRETTFALEWLTFAATLLAISIVYHSVLTVLLLAQGTFVLAVTQFAMTVAIYPMVVAVSHVFLGVRRSAPGDVDRLGRAT